MRPKRILDLLFLVAALSALSSLLFTDTPEWAPRAGIIVGAVSLLVTLWWIRRRWPTSARLLTIPFVLLGIVTSFAADGFAALPLIFVGVLLVVLEFGARAGLATVVGVVLMQAVAMTLIGSPPANTIFQTVGTASVLAFVLAFAMLLHRSEAEHAWRDELLAQRDEANARLVAANERLRSSIDTEKELLLADERARSARELHDGLGHRLTVARMSLDFSERARVTDPEAAWAEVGQARRVVEEALAEMRLWVRALNPVRVSGLTDPAAFEAIADAFRGTGVDVRIRVTGSERPLPEEAALFCYRFVQEGLTNALRHAHAGHVDLRVDFEEVGAAGAGPLVRLSLTDDGRRRSTVDEQGDPPPAPAEGFGLRSLRERALALGGTLTAAQERDGFELTAALPLPRPEEDADTASGSSTASAFAGGVRA